MNLQLKLLQYEIKPQKIFTQSFIGTGALTIGMPSFAKVKNNEEGKNELPDHGKQSFNMCGYAAPKMDVVRIGIVGLGMRGSWCS
jgi:hypothetical protein